MDMVMIQVVRRTELPMMMEVGTLETENNDVDRKWGGKKMSGEEV